MRGERLARIRESRNLSQSELAELAGLGTQQIYRYENGITKPDGEIVARIAYVLQISADYLLGLTDTTAPYIDEDLNDREALAIKAWRRGDKIAAIKLIIEDE